jgi:mono/diheme cytochrome c family protein
MKRVALAGLVALLVAWSPPRPAPPAPPPAAAEDRPSPQQVFERRILPIFKSPDPSSCVQCHLSGVDLKNYILPSHEKTFVSLRDQGLIDLDRPRESKILRLIAMGDEDKGPAALIHKKTRQAEFEAFADWIERSAADPVLRSLPKLKPEETARPPRPVEVIRHARTDRLQATFNDTVWAMRFRCMSCHVEGTPENKKLVAEHGERVAWMKAAGPEATLAYLRTSKLLDPDNPEGSTLLLKPLGVVKHGGGIKMLPGDQGYKAFRAFLDDYARVVKDGYADAGSLPDFRREPARFGTDRWLKLTDTPPAWGDKLLQADVYAWDAAKKTWEPEPTATTDRKVWGGGKLWQHNLTLLAAKGSEREAAWKKDGATLPRGRYLVKVYVDQEGRTARDWKATLGTADYVGQAEVESAWPEGYGKMTVLDAGKVRK